MKGVTSSYTRAFGESCRREFEKVSFASSGIIPSQSCIRAKYSVVWRFATSILYVYPSTPSHWLSCSKIKESVQGELFGLPRVETSMSLMMVPHLNSVVFYYKTTTWSCLSGTACSHVVAEPAHVLELTIVAHSPRIPQHYLVDLRCKLSFFFLDLMSLGYPDTNQIWISGRCDGWNISQEL
jgi:hypothetical protein